MTRRVGVGPSSLRCLSARNPPLVLTLASCVFKALDARRKIANRFYDLHRLSVEPLCENAHNFRVVAAGRLSRPVDMIQRTNRVWIYAARFGDMLTTGQRDV